MAWHQLCWRTASEAVSDVAIEPIAVRWTQSKSARVGVQHCRGHRVGLSVGDHSLVHIRPQAWPRSRTPATCPHHSNTFDRDRQMTVVCDGATTYGPNGGASSLLASPCFASEPLQTSASDLCTSRSQRVQQNAALQDCASNEGPNTSRRGVTSFVKLLASRAQSVDIWRNHEETSTR